MPCSRAWDLDLVQAWLGPLCFLLSTLPHPEPSSGPDPSPGGWVWGALPPSQRELMLYSCQVHLFWILTGKITRTIISH